MKASVTNGMGMGFVLEDVDIDAPIGAEVLVQMKASGLCRSDLSIQEHAFGGLYPLPALLGHEPAGEVIAVGPDATDFKVGDHVVGALIQSCGTCKNCLSGHSYICQNPGATTRVRASRRAFPARACRCFRASGWVVSRSRCWSTRTSW